LYFHFRQHFHFLITRPSFVRTHYSSLVAIFLIDEMFYYEEKTLFHVVYIRLLQFKSVSFLNSQKKINEYRLGYM